MIVLLIIAVIALIAVWSRMGEYKRQLTQVRAALLIVDYTTDFLRRSSLVNQARLVAHASPSKKKNAGIDSLSHALRDLSYDPAWATEALRSFIDGHTGNYGMGIVVHPSDSWWLAVLDNSKHHSSYPVISGIYSEMSLDELADINNRLGR
jgi:hypothetical protein